MLFSPFPDEREKYNPPVAEIMPFFAYWGFLTRNLVLKAITIDPDSKSWL